jgi:hypothetical protein
MQKFKLVVSWIFTVISVVGLLIIGGPEVLLLAPVLMAGFSADSPLTPDYVPKLVLVVGYGIEIVWCVLLFFAIRTIIKSEREKNRAL